MPDSDYDRIAQYVVESDLPRKRQKIDGLRRAALQRIPMRLVRTEDCDMILVDGISIDPSELENGYWL